MPVAKSLRVLFCESSPNWGGQELLACRQILWLRERGFEADLICETASQVPARAMAMGVRPITLDFRSRLAPFRLAWEYFRGGYQVISCCGYHDHQASLPLHRLGVRVIRSRHISHPIHTEIPLFTSGCSRIVCVSRNIEGMLLKGGVPPEKIRVIPNGIELSRYRNAAGGGLKEKLGLSPGAPLVGQIGMMRRDKGQDIFLAAAAALHARYPAVHFYLAGEDVQGGKMRASLEHYAEQKGFRDRVHFLGYVPDTAPILKETDLLVIASRATEASPLVLREALASRCAVVATDLGDVSDFLENERHGLVVPPGDVAALTAAIDRLLGDPTLRKRLAEAGFTLASEKFDFDQAMEKFCHVLQEDAE